MENLHIKCVYFVQKLWTTASEKKMCSSFWIYFLCWRPKEIPGQFSNDYIWCCTRMGAKAIILYMFFIVILIPGIQRINIVHQRCYKKSSHKVYIFCAETVQLLLKEKCAADIFYVEDPRKFQKESVDTIELPWTMNPYPRQSFLISFFLISITSIQRINIVHQRYY